MKLLMFYAPSFWYRTHERVLESVAEMDVEENFEYLTVVFYHVEERDEENRQSALKKMVKNIKWLSGKYDTRKVLLHSFNHLSTSKAPPEFAESLAREAIKRLENAGYKVNNTPFGYQNEWKMHVSGESLAKIFKDI